MSGILQSLDLNLVINLTILVFLVVMALAVVLSKSLLTSTILLSVFSLLMASEYLVLGAPDVAITEAAVGAAISTVFILMALFTVGDKEKRIARTKKILPFILVIFITGALLYSTLEMPPFGGKDNPSQLHVSSYYIENSVLHTGIPNAVTSILASYRGYDTFGEVIVIFTACIAVLMLIGKCGRKNNP